MSQYLLPCRCGQQFVVEPRRAGETITCECGATLQVPTMREMADLEPAPPEPAPTAARSAWGLGQQLLLLGGLLTVLALAACVWLYQSRPIAPSDVMNPESIRAYAKTFPPTQTWAYWEMAKQGIQPPDPRFAAAMTRYHAWLGVSAILALIGIVMVVSGVTMGRSSKS